jgi:hypothetical protein
MFDDTVEYMASHWSFCGMTLLSDFLVSSRIETRNLKVGDLSLAAWWPNNKWCFDLSSKDEGERFGSDRGHSERCQSLLSRRLEVCQWWMQGEPSSNFFVSK